MSEMLRNVAYNYATFNSIIIQFNYYVSVGRQPKRTSSSSSSVSADPKPKQLFFLFIQFTNLLLMTLFKLH